MPYVFPTVQPATRSYSPGTYPQTEFRAQNGALTVVRFGNRRVDSELNVGFQNIKDDEASEILENYEKVNGNWDYVIFSKWRVGQGASPSLLEYIAESGGSGLKWRYAEPPVVTSVKPGLSNVTCKFVGVSDGV